jgi:hypothetical protein
LASSSTAEPLRWLDQSKADRDALLEAAQKRPGVERVANHTHLRGYRFSW